MQYFVKYKEVFKNSNAGVSFDKTRFFNTDNMEREWSTFEELNTNSVILVDITPLPNTAKPR